MRTMASSGHGTERPGQAPDGRLVIDSAPALIHTSLPDGYLDFFNEQWLKYAGLSLEDLQGWKWTAAIHPEDVEGIVNKWRASLASGETFLHEARVRRADGQYRWMLHHKLPLRDEQGNIVKWYGSSVDIEERKKAEDALKRSETYLAEAHRLTHTGSFAYSPESRKTLYWSEELFRIFGLDPQRGIPSFDETAGLVHPDDLASVSESCLRGFREKAHFSQDYRLLLHDGSVKHLHAIWHPVLDKAGEVVEYVGTAADVTERKRAEEALCRSQAYLKEAQRLSHTGSFGWRPDTGEIVWSDETYRIFEYDPAEKAAVDMILQRTHSQDRALVQQFIEDASKSGTDFELEHRLVMRNGAIKHVHVRAHALHNSSGNIEFVGGVTDITKRKTAEEERRRSEMELRQILDFVPWQVAVLGADGTAMYLNKAGLDYHGLTREAFHGYDPRRDFHPDDRDRIVTSAGRAKLPDDQPYEIEARLAGKNGRYRWFLFQFNPLRDGEGRITRWYVTATDIEDRKAVEDTLRRENVALREEIDKTSMFEEIVGASPALRAVLARVSKVAPTDSGVLITGETGTGKELIARAIHKQSKRSSRAFVAVNCAAIPRDLIASELFGHEKGAFTGALQRRLGRFEVAEGGTIFLDEVGELPVETQIALLRVLQEREFERVGSNQPIRADVRVIAASNRDMEASIAAGSFRKDLFYRLNVFPIETPSLRERKEDIAMLVEYFVDRYARETGKKIRSIEKNTMELLRSYSWPGNIRELQSVIERSVIVCETETFSVDPSWISIESSRIPSARPPSTNRPSAQEKQRIEAVLAETGGRVSGPSGAAAMLGVPASTLESKIRSLKINKFRFKDG